MRILSGQIWTWSTAEAVWSVTVGSARREHVPRWCSYPSRGNSFACYQPAVRAAAKGGEKGEQAKKTRDLPFYWKIKLYSVRWNSWQEVIGDGEVQPDLQLWLRYRCTCEFIFCRQAFIALMRTHVLYCGALL